MQKSTHFSQTHSRLVLAALAATMVAPSIVAPTLISSAHAQLDSAPAYGTIRVFLNGREISFDGVAPIQESGRTLVPMRAVFEALGAFVDFNAATQVIRATKGATRVQLTLGSTQAFVNSQPRVLDVPARTVQGRTLVPFRFAAESFGANVDWNPNTRIINISTNASSNPDNTTPDITSEVSGNVTRYDSDTGTLALRIAPTTTSTTASNRTFTLASNVRFFRRTTGRVLRGETPTFSAPLAANEAALATGADVVLQLNGNNEVTRVTISASVLPARIRDVQGDQITLDDGRDTILTPGANLRFYDARGRETTDLGSLAPGQRVALFVAPSTRRPFAISATAADVRLADDVAAGALPENGDGDGGTDASGTPQINLVQQNATRPLRAGQILAVTVRGTPGMRATFSIVPDVPETDMIEDRARPGVYTGSYIVQGGDNILNGRVSATLRGANGREAFQQSQTAVTIDTLAPRITGTAPANGASIGNSQPNIVINANDVGGSGLGSANVTINGVQVATEDITISSNAVTIVNSEALDGQVNVVATVLDRAGNQARRSFSFSTTNDNSGGNSTGDDITSFSSNATSDVQIGDRVTVDLRAPIGGRATVEVLNKDRRTIRQTVRLTEIADGRYRATFSVPDTGDSVFYLRARFTNANGDVSTREASAPIYVANSGGSNNTIDRLTITSPRADATVSNSLVVEGRAEPNSTVEVSVTAQGTRYLVFEYSNDLGTQQVQTDASGNWSTNSISLPRPGSVSNLRYVISATQTDSDNTRSEPVTVTVTPR